MQMEKLFLILKLTKEHKVPSVAFMFTGEVKH